MECSVAWHAACRRPRPSPLTPFPTAHSGSKHLQQLRRKSRRALATLSIKTNFSAGERIDGFWLDSGSGWVWAFGGNHLPAPRVTPHLRRRQTLFSCKNSTDTPNAANQFCNVNLMSVSATAACVCRCVCTGVCVQVPLCVVPLAKWIFALQAKSFQASRLNALHFAVIGKVLLWQAREGGKVEWGVSTGSACDLDNEALSKLRTNSQPRVESSRAEQSRLQKGSNKQTNKFDPEFPRPSQPTPPAHCRHCSPASLYLSLSFSDAPEITPPPPPQAACS